MTLEKMARGGVYDQLGGGFHRYSVDEAWVVPHFEKMLYDNAEPLKNYVHAFQSFVDPESAKRGAPDIIRWMDSSLTDRERGGFYASQDADINLDDDGDYFTWTHAEAAAVLTPEEMEIAGHLPRHRRSGRHAPESREERAACEAPPGPPRSRRHCWPAAKAKLLEARGKRPTPFIDTTVYTNWNALAVSAYLEAAQVLRLPEVKRFALLTLDRLLREGLHAERGLAHVISYNEGAETRWVAGMLDDYAFLIHACVDGWLATGEYEVLPCGAGLGPADDSRNSMTRRAEVFSTLRPRARSCWACCRHGVNLCRIRPRLREILRPRRRCCGCMRWREMGICGRRRRTPWRRLPGW